MTMLMKRLSFILLLSALSSATMHAATYTAASCSETDVAAAVAHAANGDTVSIPSCSAGVSWTTSLTVTTAINLLGQGVGNTVLIDNVPKGNSNCSGGAPLITMNVSSNLPLRLGEFTITGSAPDTYICQPGHIVIQGGSHSFRIDDITINNQQTAGIRTFGDLQGLIDHMTMNALHKQGVIIFYDTWGGVGSYGDNSWAQADTIGTSQAIYIEDSTFNDSSAVGAGSFDCFDGGRLVFRHNTSSFIVNHGTDSSERDRSCRQYEVYNNTFNDNGESINTVFNDRGGTGVYFNNTITGSNYTSIVLVANYRDPDAFPPWGACDGTGAYDQNNGTVYASGTYNGSNGVSNVLTDTTKSWTANQWTGGYAIRNTTAGWGSAISSNTATTITNFSSDYGQSRTWNSGDSYQILRANLCIDQVGRGAGTYLSGATPSPTGWANEALRPFYQWGDTFNGSPSGLISAQYAHVQANRDYYAYTTSFNGTSGTGSGLLSARPATCTPNVAYWATDTNTLYQCSSANTWTTYYQPYTYPHPLQGGGPATSPSCTPISGTVPQLVTCTNPNSGTTIMCYAVSPTTPATSGDGATCSTGTKYTTTLSISSPETLNVIAGVAGDTDSSVVSYVYSAALSAVFNFGIM